MKLKCKGTICIDSGREKYKQITLYEQKPLLI